MDDDNLRFWKKMAEPPKSAQSPIRGKRYQGTDIKPQWRILALTEQFGPCGIGWSMEVVRAWREEGHAAGHSIAVVEVKLYIKDGGEWGKGISGVGGCILTGKDNRGEFSDDDAYKKATTDAFGKAAAMVGVGANVYMGNASDSKYYEEPNPTQEQKPAQKESGKQSQSSGRDIPPKDSDFLTAMKHWQDNLPNFTEILGGLGWENAEQVPNDKHGFVLYRMKEAAK